MSCPKKIILTIALIPVGIIFAVGIFLAILFIPSLNQPQPITFGVTFSKPFAEWLGLDWQKAYLEILDDLEVKNLRLISYWNEIEKKEGQFDFQDLDWQIEKAKERDAEVILVLGQKVPRWPECHYPDWISGADKNVVQDKTLNMLREVILHYKDKDNIKAWQVENEPLFFLFGQCPFFPSRGLLKKEIALVRSLDSRPIIITDSGELSTWFRSAHLGDYLGTTMYRVTWNPLIGFFYYDHVFAPAFYRVKGYINGLSPSKIIISELQAEAWGEEQATLLSLSQAEQKKSLDAERFRKNLDFASRTGFSYAYLWGAEYWYWLKDKNGDDSLWQAAKEIWQK
jgi:hypothetical protein